MKAILSMLLVATLLGGCGTRSVADAHSWFIESYDNGIITVQHEGYTYKASCDTSQSFNNAGSISDHNNVIDFPTCDTAIALVGHGVQPFDGKQLDPSGRIVVMWSVGHTLALRSWKDEQTPWRQEHFLITSVKKAAR
jgi:hypothetical protein